MWLYDDTELTEVPEGYVGFVYLITNQLTGRQYVGKKNFFSTRRKRVAGKSRRKTITTESDWREYHGSNSVLVADVQTHGVQHFRHQILRLCKSKAEMSYYEIKEQIDREVLFKPEAYYNNFIGCRIHGKHMKKS
jgi:hypothetical protein